MHPVHRFLALVVLLILTSCNPAPDTPLLVSSPMGADRAMASTRFTVTRVGVISDDLAYGNRRGIYTIKDNLTGAEYVGLSGVGISELGSHRSGKSTHRDER